MLRKGTDKKQLRTVDKDELVAEGGQYVVGT